MAEDEDKENDVKVYGFDEAIDLTGTGWYNWYLLVTLSLTLLFMAIDMFGFSVVVHLSSCTLELDMMQKSILLSIPFLGSILSGHAWGYVADTRGRRFSLIIGMSIGFIACTLSAFSPNWIVLGVLKFIGTCFCSCAQSVTYAMLGESCPEKIKAKYLVILASAVNQAMPIYLTVGYLYGDVADYAWQLVAITLAIPLGICTVLLWFCYESPKFLLNAGQDKEALDVLRRIHKWNCNKNDEYPVEKLVHKEFDNKKSKDVPFMTSVWRQTIPLFKPPLLFYTLLLYYFVICLYGIPGGIFIWIPFISGPVVEGGPDDFTQGMCTAITRHVTINTSNINNCKPIDLMTVLVCLVCSNVNFALNIFISLFAKRRRILIFVILTLATICCFLTTLIPNKASGVAYFGIIITTLGIGPVLSYFVDLYPTSYRGMAVSMGMVMARIGCISIINLVAVFITTHCTYTFYTLGTALAVCAMLTSVLPPDLEDNKFYVTKL